MILGYNTNGLAHHRLFDALELCARVGYRGVAITLDIAHLDPASEWQDQAQEVRARARDLGLVLTVETGGRFLLDPARKHYPNLMSMNREAVARRIAWYQVALEIAHSLGAPLLSLWSGAAESSATGSAGDSEPAAQGFERLAAGLVPIVHRAQELEIQVGFEPEPGMFVETPAQYSELKRVGGAALSALGMTLDVGHCLVTGGQTPAEAIAQFAPEIVHVHLDDIRAGVHEHLMFGAGDLDLEATLGALEAIQFEGMAAVELSRDSHRGAEAAQLAFDFLTRR